MLREGSGLSKVTQLLSGRVLHPACGLYRSPQRSLREGWVTAPPLTAGDVGVLCTSIFSCPDCLKAEEGFEGGK